MGWLAITWAGVIDNGEGDVGFHGPVGSLHILIYPALLPCPKRSGASDYDNYIAHAMLLGPTTDGKEWADGDYLDYWNTYEATGFRWITVCEWPSGVSELLLFIYESDPSSWNGIHIPIVDLIRKHDPLLCVKVKKADTYSFSPHGKLYYSSPDVYWADYQSNDQPLVWVQDLSPNVLDPKQKRYTIKFRQETRKKLGYWKNSQPMNSSATAFIDAYIEAVEQATLHSGLSLENISYEELHQWKDLIANEIAVKGKCPPMFIALKTFD